MKSEESLLREILRFAQDDDMDFFKFFVKNGKIIALVFFKIYNSNIMKKSLLISGIVLLIVIVQLLFRSVFEQLELVSYDFRAQFATDFGPFAKRFKHADSNIVVVTEDDYSNNEIANNPQLNLGSWPWRRDVWAEMVNFIEKGKPKAILFDIIFNNVNSAFSYDAKLADTFRKYDNIVLAASVNHPKSMVDKFGNSEVINNYFVPTGKPLDVEIDDQRLDDKMTYYSHSPIYNCYTKFNTMGITNIPDSRDSVIRSSQPIFKLVKGDKTYYMPSLAFAGFLKYMGEGDKIVIKKNKIHYKGRTIPVENDATSYVSWHGTGHDYSFIPISKVLLNQHNEKDLKADYFKDKIVIIGRTEAGTDIHSSAVNPNYPGPEVNATVIDNFINDTDLTNSHARKFITKTSTKMEALIIFAFCCLIAGIGLISKNALFALLNSILLLLFYVLASIFLYVNPSIRVWIPVVVPLYYMLVTAGIVFAYRLQQEAKKKAEILGMFGKLVSPKVLETLLKTQGELTLKNTKKHITVMFCDVKDFTSLSEKCDPEQLVSNLNELFNEIVNIIFENNGTVDKFVGDCIMAYWGDPMASEDDPYMAVKTALEIKKKVDELKVKNIRENKIVFDVKIGINTSDALLGLTGSTKIMSYTAMGDAVNVAARLESSCTKLKHDILISKSTYEAAKDKIVVLDVGSIEVKGRDERVKVYEPIGFSEKE